MKTNVKTNETETAPETATNPAAEVKFDFNKVFETNDKNKSKTIKYLATLPEFQKGDKVDLGKIVKAFKDAGIKASTGGDMRYQFVRNVLTAKPKKA